MENELMRFAQPSVSVLVLVNVGECVLHVPDFNVGFESIVLMLGLCQVLVLMQFVCRCWWSEHGRTMGHATCFHSSCFCGTFEENVLTRFLRFPIVLKRSQASSADIRF